MDLQALRIDAAGGKTCLQRRNLMRLDRSQQHPRTWQRMQHPAPQVQRRVADLAKPIETAEGDVTARQRRQGIDRRRTRRRLECRDRRQTHQRLSELLV
ncbi:hypothetical protein D3C78_1446590 [compost metagenome]